MRGHQTNLPLSPTNLLVLTLRATAPRCLPPLVQCSRFVGGRKAASVARSSGRKCDLVAAPLLGDDRIRGVLPSTSGLVRDGALRENRDFWVPVSFTGPH
ncbi:hypothetical protein SprV_0200950000 [Sparganum proliferum]